MSVRITAAGAVALLCLPSSPRLSAPAMSVTSRSARSASAAAAAAAEAHRSGAGRQAQVRRPRAGGRVAALQAHAFRQAPRAPGFAVKRERGMHARLRRSSRAATLLPESALARRFRGFIDPAADGAERIRGVAQAAHRCASISSRPIVCAGRDRSTAVAAEAPVAAARPAPSRAEAGPRRAEAGSGHGARLGRVEARDAGRTGRPANPAILAAANAAPAPVAPQAFVSATPPLRRRSGAEPVLDPSAGACAVRRAWRCIGVALYCRGMRSGARRTIAIAAILSIALSSVAAARSKRRPRNRKRRRPRRARRQARPRGERARHCLQRQSLLAGGRQCGGIYFKLGAVYSDAAIRAKVVKPDPAAYA